MRVFYTIIISIIAISIWASPSGRSLPLPEESIAQVEQDTIPIKPRYGNFVEDKKKNPFDITPTIVEQKVEYDPKTGHYVVFEKIGEEYFRTPTYLTFNEYLDWKAKQQERAYFDQLAGINSGKKGRSFTVDPMEKIDIQKNLVDRLFGGSEVDIQPQGNIDLTFGLDYYRTENPNIPLRQQSPGVLFDFDMGIEMSVDGKIGEKMNLDFNYDTQSTFDFDRRIKLGYDSEQFGEDDIVKKIEAGNVSLPLRGQLIQGNQNLFGLKTELQFGHLKLTALASQQRSERNNIRVQDGASVQRFELRPDQYDENRHFFLSHFNRDNYEDALQNIPFTTTSFRISRIEVWISEDRSDYQQGSKIIAAISDLAEGDEDKFTNPDANYEPSVVVDPILRGVRGDLLADNRINPIYEELQDNNDIDDIDKTATLLKQTYNMQQTRDFEVFRGRKLSPSEFTYNEQLGFISLNTRLRPNQVLGVSYQYFYTANCDEIYQVGDMSSEGEGNTVVRETVNQQPESPNLTFVKLLKSTNQRVDLSTWDLMMKNVYPMNTGNLSREDFEFDIFFEDDTDGSLKKYLPFGDLAYEPLLNVFNLDNVNTQLDPQPDGIFDFLPGITVIPRNGSVVFPVLEPFGKSLRTLIQDSMLVDRLVYQELYDTTLVGAREQLEKNKFVMRAQTQNGFSGEINLGPFVPRGSVRVTAGGRRLIENQDYEIDYSLGKLRIINPAYLQQGTQVNVSFEDNSIFNLQQKTMLGLRAEYEFSDKFNIGATYLRLFERPFTQKVNLGDDPINNRIFGLDLNYSTESQALTKMVDKLPFFSTKEESFINFNAEVAALRPGHSGAINLSDDEGGVVNIDDFEGTITGLLLGSTRTNDWVLSSTPAGRPESDLENNLSYGANRALLNWYVIDNAARGSEQDRQHPYSRIIQQNELFQRQTQPGLNVLFTFDMSYYPEERGPYNFDVPDGTPYSAGLSLNRDGSQLLLNKPETRWGGIMRYFSNTDFQAANYESIEFWVLNPFMERRDGKEHREGEIGKIVFHLGSISEDVLNDNRQFYENSIPILEENENLLVDTEWGRVSNIVPIVDGFDQIEGSKQDLGFDGLTDELESERFSPWLAQIGASFPIPTEVLRDPANDNYLYFNSDEFGEDVDLISRYKDFNNPQGNAPLTSTTDNTEQRLRGNPRPDKEDLNNNKSLDEAENYYEYELQVVNTGGEVDMSRSNYIREKRTIVNQANGGEEIWYRVRIPLNDGISVGGIDGFRAIQFMRMFITGYSSPKTFRLAEFQLRRNAWRVYPATCASDASSAFDFVLDDVGIEENSDKRPFNYVSPRGIQQEQIFQTFGNLLQDEKSMQINYCGIGESCEGSLYKLSNLDLTFYKKLQMFVHAESDPSDENMEDGDMALFVRIGKDFERNFYEYEMPLVLSDESVGIREQSNIWQDTNYINFELDILKDLKLLRKEAGLGGLDTFETVDPNNERAIRKIVGNPSLGYVKVIQIGIRNNDPEGDTHCGEVWVNELRASGLEQRGGYAGLARLQLQLADLGEVNLSGSYSSVGWGQIDQKLQERAREELIEYDVSTNLELGKFLPAKANISVPFYAQYSKSSSTPLFDPYQLDLTTDETLQLADSEEERQEIIDRAKETTTVKAFNFTNVRKSGGGKKKPWSPENFSITYAYSETVDTDPIIRENKLTETSATIDYNYSRSPSFIEPFKSIKSPALKLISGFNFNLLPNTFRVSSTWDRTNNTRTFRFPDTPLFTFDNKRFLWDRKYDLQWDLTKSLKLDFTANSSSMIDELRQVGIADRAEDRRWVNETGEDFSTAVQADRGTVRDYWWDNLTGLGRAKDYDHQLRVTYNVPINLLPLMDWTSVKLDYTADYAWQAAPLIIIDELGNGPGNTIQNNQVTSLVTTLNFDKLYQKWGYLKNIEGNRNNARRTRTTRRRTTRNRNNNQENGQDESEEEPRTPSTVEKILVRPLLALRDIRINYRETRSTLLPAFNPEAKYLGLSGGFDAPGLGFVFGSQPNLDPTNQNNWLYRAADQGWINTSPNINDQISQLNTHTLDIQVGLEPFSNFIVDLDFKKTYRRTHTEVFKNKNLTGDPEFLQLAGYDIGSFDESYLALGTLFGNPPEDLYLRFKNYREVISNRLPNVDNPEEHPSDPGYAAGYGERSYDVIIPSFIAAYEGKDINTVDVDLERQLSNRWRIPAPQWSLRYDGLKDLPIFKNILSGFSLTHAYRSNLKVNRFNSIPNYDPLNPFQEFDSGSNYYTRLEIPTMSIVENFAPLLGLSFKTKNDINFDFQYKKGRQLDLSLQTDLRDSRNTELVLGVGFTMKNIGANSTRRNRRQQEDQTNSPRRNNRSRSGVSSSRGKSLVFNLDFSIRDNISYVFNFLSPTEEAQPERGTLEISFNPVVDYNVSENLTLRFFTQYRRSEPKVTNSFATTNINGGMTLRFKLN